MLYSLPLWDYISLMSAKHVDAGAGKPVVSAQVCSNEAMFYFVLTMTCQQWEAPELPSFYLIA